MLLSRRTPVETRLETGLLCGQARAVESLPPRLHATGHARRSQGFWQTLHGQKVAWLQFVVLQYLPVRFPRHRPGIGIVPGQGFAEGDMDMPLVTGKALGNGAIIFARFLDITSGARPLLQLPRFHLVAGVPFVGNGHRYNVEAADNCGKVLALAAHAQHLDDRRVGLIQTVLGAPLSLGYPDGVACGYGMVYVGRQRLIDRELLTAPGDRAVNNETLVQTHEITDERTLQQIVANGDPWRRMTRMVQRVIDEGGIHDDIPVIGQKQMRTILGQVLEAAVTDRRDTALDQPVQIRLHAMLQVIHTVYIAGLTAQAGANQAPDQPRQPAMQAGEMVAGKHAQQLLVPRQTVQYAGNLVIAVGPYRIKLDHVILIKASPAAHYAARRPVSPD